MQMLIAGAGAGAGASKGREAREGGYNEATKNTNQCDWIELNWISRTNQSEPIPVEFRCEWVRERNRNRNNNKNTNKTEKKLKTKKETSFVTGVDVMAQTRAQSTERWAIDCDGNGDCDGGSRPVQARPNRKANAKMPNLLPTIRQKSLRHQKLLQMRDAPCSSSCGTSSHGRIAQSASQHFAKNISMITQWTIGWNGNASNRVAVPLIVVAPPVRCCGRVQQNHNKRLEQRTWATKRSRERVRCRTSVEKESKKLVTVVMAVKVKECVKVVWWNCTALAWLRTVASSSRSNSSDDSEDDDDDDEDDEVATVSALELSQRPATTLQGESKSPALLLLLFL